MCGKYGSCGGAIDCTFSLGGGGQNVVSQIILPATGLSYSFGYTSPDLHYGELKTITLPSTADAAYSYALENSFK